MLLRVAFNTSRPLVYNNGEAFLLRDARGLSGPSMCRRLKSSSSSYKGRNASSSAPTSASVASLLNLNSTKGNTSSSNVSESTPSLGSSPPPKVISKKDNQGEGPTSAQATKIPDKPSTLPYLPHPLGVPERPTTVQKTWKDTTLEMLDQDKRLAQRKHIIKEATRGYFSDLNAVRKNGGKAWIAPTTLIRQEFAKFFPNISGRTLVNADVKHTAELCEGRISVVALISSMISNEHTNSFVDMTHAEFNENPYYNFLQINLEDNKAKAFLRTMYISSLRRQTPLPLHGQYMLSSQNMEYLREPLGMNNKHIGYVYLLDSEQRIRWAGAGLALDQEARSLHACTKVLLDRMGSGKTT